MGRILLSLGFALAILPLFGADFNIHVYTDNVPDYTDLDSYEFSATDLFATDQEKCIQIWKWASRTTHQMSRTAEKGRGIFDHVLQFNSYPNTFCGFYAAFNTTVWEHMGYKAQYVELGDHTVSQVSWDGGTSYHLFDSSMRMYCLKHDGVVASCQDIMDANTCSLSEGLGAAAAEPGHSYLYHFAKECGTNPVDPIGHPNLTDPWGYRGAVDNPVPNARTLRNGADSYTSGFTPSQYSTHSRRGFKYSLDLHPYQVYTRYFRELGDTQDYYRTTSGSFNGDPNDSSNFGNMRGNGHWEFDPDLSTTAYRKVLFSENATIHRTEDGGSGPEVRPAAAGAPAEIIFKVNSANVTTSAAIHIEGIRNNAGDTMTLSYSVDGGTNWNLEWTASTTGAVNADIPLNYTKVGGEFQYLIKIDLNAAALNTDCGIDKISIDTITQLNAHTIPSLVRGANKVNFHLGDEQTEHLMLWPALHSDQHLDTAVDSANIWTDTGTDAFYKPTVRPILGNTETYITWKFSTPNDIQKIEYGGEFCSRSGSADSWVRLRHSFDGSTWTQDYDFNEGAEPFNEIHLETVTGLPPGQKDVWLKYDFRHTADQSYTSTGFSDAWMYVSYTPNDTRFQPVEVTFNWTEHRSAGDVTREHTQLISSSEAEWDINVDGYKDPTMNWMRINLKTYGPDGHNVVYGYSDAVDVGTGAGYDKKHYDWDWEDNAAFQKTYTVSRAAAGSNGDTGGTELTDGNIAPPTGYTTTASAQALTAFWDGDTAVTVTVDLGSTNSIEAFRIITHQPNATWCHPETIDIQISDDNITYSAANTINHDDLYSPPGNYLPWEQDKSLNYASLPAGGRLTYPFWHVPAVPASGRYIKCTFNPQTGKGVGISEIQAFTAVSITDWPDKEIAMPAVTDLSVDTISVTPDSGDIPLDVTFNITVSGGTGPYSFDWDFGDGNSDTVEDPAHQYTAGGSFQASVVVTDVNGKRTWAETHTAALIAGGQSISGAVSGDTLAGVTMTLSGDWSDTTITDGSGLYSFTALPAGNFTITPSLADHVFTPVSQDTSISGSNVTGIDFSNNQTFNISGTVTGDAQENVLINLTGDASAAVLTASDGTYNFSSLINGSYTVTPSLTNYIFTNTSEPVTVSGGDVAGTDFTSTAVYTASGSISGDILGGVTLTLSGDASSTAVSAGDGSYSFPGLIDGNYTITPSLVGYEFTNASEDIAIAGAALANINFSAQRVYSISGTLSGDILAGITLTLSGDASDAIVTAGDGSFSFTGLLDGNYIITPSLAGYIFLPSAWGITIGGDEVINIDFTAASVVAGHYIMGAITGDVLQGVTVTLSGDGTAAAVTGPAGMYIFNGLSDGLYTVMPSLAGFTFGPLSQDITVAGTPMTGIDFTASGSVPVPKSSSSSGGNCGTGIAGAGLLAPLFLAIRRKYGSKKQKSC